MACLQHAFGSNMTADGPLMPIYAETAAIAKLCHGWTVAVTSIEA